MDKNKIFKFVDIFLASILSLIITTRVYKYLYDICRYSGLNDFYVGTSIYIDHNKYLDVYIYFLYLLLFFIFVFFISFVRRKIIITSEKTIQKEEKESKEQGRLIQKIKKFTQNCKSSAACIEKYAIKHQYLGLLGFIFLHPFDGCFYPKAALIILMLISAGIFDIKRNKKNKSLSPFTITALVFLLVFISYNTGFAPSDDHHFGEKFTAFLMHNNFNLQYYKDIMLVHGYIDVIPSAIGAFLFDANNIYGYCLGEIFFKNILFILIIFFASCIFKNNVCFIAPLLLLKVPTATFLYICTYIIMLKKEILNKPYLALSIYILFAFIFTLIWSTIGSFWAIAAIPFAVFSLYKIIKTKDYKQLILPVMVTVFLILIFGETFFEYLKIMPYYLHGNLPAFGSGFEYLYACLPKYINFFCKMFALFFVPILILNLPEQIKNKNTENILFLLFFTIFPLVSLPYTLGRIDGELMQRIAFISLPYMLIILPYYLYKFSNKNYRTFFQLIFITAAVLAIFQIPYKFQNIVQETPKTKSTLYNVGEIKLKHEEEKRLNDIQAFVYKQGGSISFLDLTNGGMIYLYLNKQIPIRFTSFYNSISSAQSDEAAGIIKTNPPDIILIKSKFNMLDGVYPSLRVNSIYREILLNRLYKIEEYRKNVFLVKNNNINCLSSDDKEILDNILSNANLNFLPEVWAKSIKKLPVKTLHEEFYQYTDGNEIIIKFLNRKKQSDMDFLFLDVSSPAKFNIRVNNSNSELKCKSRTGKILVPLDNFPSWLLNEDLTEIKIEITGSELHSPKIEFYNKINKP